MVFRIKAAHPIKSMRRLKSKIIRSPECNSGGDKNAWKFFEWGRGKVSHINVYDYSVNSVNNLCYTKEIRKIGLHNASKSALTISKNGFTGISRTFCRRTGLHQISGESAISARIHLPPMWIECFWNNYNPRIAAM